MSADADGRLWCVVPPHARFSYLDDPEKTAAGVEGDRPTARRSPSATSAGSTRRATSSSTGGARTWSSAAASTSTRPRSSACSPSSTGSRTSPSSAATTSAGAQRVCAAVVGTVEADALAAYAREHLAPAKRPKEWHLLDALPRTADRQGATPRPARPGHRLMGFTRAELEAFRDTEVPDLLPRDDLRLLFVGINPGLWTAAVQTHFAHPANRFYPALLRAGIIDRADRPLGRHDRRGPRPLPRPRPGDHQPRRACHRPGLRALPRGAPRGRRAPARARRAPPPPRGGGARRDGLPLGVRPPPKATLGRQADRIADADLWVLPNPSGLNAHETTASLAEAYAEPARAAGLDVGEL